MALGWVNTLKSLLKLSAFAFDSHPYFVVCDGIWGKVSFKRPMKRPVLPEDHRATSLTH